VISRRQVLRHLTEAKVRRQIAVGLWQVAHRGIFVTHNGPLTSRQRTWVGLLAAGGGQPRLALAGLSALAEVGFCGFPPPVLEVYVPAGTHPKSVPRYVRIRRVRGLTPIDFETGVWPPRATPERSVIDAARWAYSDDRARAIITAAVQQRIAEPQRLLEAAYRVTRLRRRALIFATIHDAAGGSESISEQDFLLLCRDGGLPTPTRQSVIQDRSGRNRYRDAHFEEWGLHVEIDGSQHMDATSWWADMQRQNDMWTPGTRVLRFPAWAIRNEPDKVIAILRQALIEAGWRP
jgi:hypothetical protein